MTERREEERHERPDVWDLLPSYALDAVDGLERRLVERLIDSDAEARRALDEYREVVAAFAVEAEPPAALRAQVLEAVARTPQARPASSGGSARPGEPAVVPTRGRPAVARRWLAAAVVAAAVAAPTVIAVQAVAERDRLRQQHETVAQMLVAPDATVLRSDVAGGGEAAVLVAGDEMFFRANGLPDPGDGRDYQLWVVASDGEVSSAGVLSIREGEASSLVEDSAGVGLALTVEPEGGSQQPTSDPVVVLRS